MHLGFWLRFHVGFMVVDILVLFHFFYAQVSTCSSCRGSSLLSISKYVRGLELWTEAALLAGFWLCVRSVCRATRNGGAQRCLLAARSSRDIKVPVELKPRHGAAQVLIIIGKS